MEDLSKIKEWDYMGKRYRWTKKAQNQGYMTCTCPSCQRHFNSLLESGQLEEIITGD